MSRPKKMPQTFDEHLGRVVDGLAGPHGGRAQLAVALGTTPRTIERRMTGATPFLVKELAEVARFVHATERDIVAQALRNYGGGDEEAGLAMLRAEHTPASEDETSSTNVGGPHEDNYEVTPGGTRKADLALAANKRRRKVDTAPYAE